MTSICIFDAYGTLFDVTSATRTVATVLVADVTSKRVPYASKIQILVILNSFYL